jgi:hypothetical protein
VKDLGEETNLSSIKGSSWENERGVGVEVKGTETELYLNSFCSTLRSLGIRQVLLNISHSLFH